MRIFLIFILLSFSLLGLSQESCDDEQLDKLFKELRKEDRKRGIKHQVETVYKMYSVAECYRKRNDPLAATFYFRVSERQKGLYVDFKKIETQFVWLKMGAFSAYWGDDFKFAERYFLSLNGYKKHFPEDKDVIEALYYRGLSLMKLKKYQEAIEAFEQYKLNPKAERKVDDLVLECKSKS